MNGCSEGKLYSVEVLHDQEWKGWFVTSDADGFWNPLLVIGGKRLSVARCFQLCGDIKGLRDEHYFIIGKKLPDFVAPASGQQGLFANDSKNLNYYSNNRVYQGPDFAAINCLNDLQDLFV